MKFLTLIIALCVSAITLAAPAPFDRTTNLRFNSVESNQTTLLDYFDYADTTGIKMEPQLKVAFTQATASVAGASVAVASIPANSIIEDAFFFFDTTVTSASSNTIAVTCGSTTLMSASSYVYQAADVIVDTVSSRALINGGSACDVAVVIGSGTSGVTAMDVKGVIKYNVMK